MLKDFIDYYLDNIDVRESTKEAYRYALKSLYNALGDVAVRNIKTLDIQNFLYALKNKSKQTRKDYFAAVRTALKQARRWGIIETSPWEGVVLPRVYEMRGSAYSAQELSYIVQKLRGHTIYPFVLLAATCGLRISEIAGLRLCDVREDSISIKVQLVRRKNAENALKVPCAGKTKLCLADVKTASSSAEIAIPQIVSDALQQVIKYRPRDIYSTGLLFLQHDGRPYEASHIRKLYKKTLRELQIPLVLRFHDLRHTAASILLNEKVSVKAVQQQLRHAKAETTLNIYAHLKRNDRSAATAFDKIFPPVRE